MDSYLTRMSRINASDIDIGGLRPGRSCVVPASTARNARPRNSGKFHVLMNYNILIQTNSDRASNDCSVYENRNLDFSYSIMDDERMLRFRANARFDLDHSHSTCAPSMR